MIPRLALAATLLIFVATGSSSAQPRLLAVHASGTPAPVAVPVSSSWTTYHHDNGHTGYDPAAPAITSVGATPGWTETALDGQIYAEPLVYNGSVFAATLNNTVYALNQLTGAVTWAKHVVAPLVGGWTCGNFTQQGILGTPVIDVVAGRIYVAALGSDGVYRLFGLDLATGNIALTTTLMPAGFDWKIEQQRGALSLANGYVYVPFGGRAGDCGSYHGYVAGVPTGGGTPNYYQTPNTGMGIWAAGGVAIDNTTGTVFAATGNGSCGSVNQNDAVVRLSPTLAMQDYFMPQDWQAHWCNNDQDLGSAGPLLISPSLMFQSGKWGGGFLLDPTNLGHVNGQVFPSPTNYSQAEACLGNHSDATFGSFAYAAPFVYVECEGSGIVALRVDTAAKTFAPCPASCPASDWNASTGTTFGPPIVAGGAVWAASDGNGLYAFNQTTGAQIFHSANFNINRFVTPSEAGGQVFVPAKTVIKSFSINGSVTVTPASLNFNGQVPGTTSSAQTVTLHNGLSTSVSVVTATVTGANAGQYLKGTDTCSPATVAPGGTCTVQVSFKPTAAGSFPATLTFTDNAPSTPQSVPLGGLGVSDNQGHIYTLDGYGGVHPDGSSPALTSNTYFGWNIARSLSLFTDGLGGYSLDGYGGLHPVGNATNLVSPAYWQNWDIARQVVLAPWASQGNPAGWILDGYGGIHPFGGAPALSGAAFFGWDIARGLVILPDSTAGSVAGYTLDGYGGVHPIGGAPVISNNGYWSGWDIAKGITLTAGASKSNPSGWTLDGYGGLHPFGSGPAITNGAYFGWDIARGVVSWTGGGGGGWVLDGYGGVHPFGSAPAISPVAYWPNWDIATGLAAANFGTGSRHHV